MTVNHDQRPLLWNETNPRSSKEVHAVGITGQETQLDTIFTQLTFISAIFRFYV